MADQEPKYQFEMGRAINRASGDAIPLDEPIMLFRARDLRAVAMIRNYLSLVRRGPQDHINAVRERLDAFEAFAREHPDRMKISDTDPTP